LLLPRFHYHEPSTLDEACQLMADLAEGAKPLAGGTDLIVNMRKGTVSPDNVISLARIERLAIMDFSNGRSRIGACRKVSELTQSDEMAASFQALCLGANSFGSPLIRNLATIGGNLVSARPAADLPPPLMAYGASVLLKNASREREVSLKEFFRGPGLTVMEPDEILVEISIKKPPPNSGSGYIKLGVRNALDISIVNVAAFLVLDDGKEMIRSARVVLGAVAPMPMRAFKAEKLLIGEKPNEALFIRVGEEASTESRPIDNFRGSAEYRRAMVAVLTRRALDMAFKEAKRIK
jgi:CO/xanthine dehydrogenase FAD-binding subunit